MAGQAVPFDLAGSKPLRALKVLNCATKLSRLDLRHQAVGLNTNVPQLEKWRDEGLTAEWIHCVVRQPGELPVKTAKDLLVYLTSGSPRLRSILYLIKIYRVLHPPDEDPKSHRKMLIVEGCPLNAWFTEVVLNTALVSTRTMHAGLNNLERECLVDEFNNPESPLKVLVITYDIGLVGLNLHTACNLVVLSAPGKSWSQEAQAFGRCLRVYSSLSRNT